MARRYGMDRKTVARYWRSGGDLEDRRRERASGFARHDGVIRAKSLLPGITKRAVYEFLLNTCGEDLPCYGAFTRCCRTHDIPFGAAARREAHPRFGLATLMWTVPGGAQETGGPYMRDPRHPRHFTDEFKRQIVDLYNAGKPKREIMDEYDLGKSTVERRVKSINATGSPRAADNRTPEQNRILELERENRRLRMEVDVLKQAALIYARK